MYLIKSRPIAPWRASRLPLARLLRYAYGLRDVTAVEETSSPTTRHGLHDLLIALLAAEVEELLHRGLARRYIPLSEDLESPRGRILINQVIDQGGVRDAPLPCSHFERRPNWHLNLVLRAGLEASARMAEDRNLRRRAYQLSSMFGDVGSSVRLGAYDIDRAERDLARLTAACGPALTSIRLLHDMQGIAFDSGQLPSRMPGFSFDMNVFFQRLLSRFLHDNLARARIADEQAIRNLFAYATDANPRQRRAPAPRPDFALFCDKALLGFSVLLYASMFPEARDERVEVRQPELWSSNRPASVILRPVPLPYLAQLLDPSRGRRLAGERRLLAEQLVMPRTRKYDSLAA